MPWPVLADTGTNGESPPNSSGTTCSATSSCLTRSVLASGLSILLIATTIGTPAAFACWIASLVCGITPSSAATTRITMSVALRAAGTHRGERLVARGVEEGDHAARRLDVVGADVLRDAAGFARRDLGAADVVEQRGLAVVDVAHDGDDRRARQRFARRRCRRPLRVNASGSSSLAATALWPISSTTIIAVSWSSCWLMVTIWPSFISCLMTSDALTDILCARSATVMVSGTCTSCTLLLGRRA